jgi:hypothetical protein
MPVSRLGCISTSATRPTDRKTWMTARNWSIAKW